MERFDVVVIGGGPAGYPAAIRSRQMGLSACLIETGDLGGVCLNRGCIPTKALVSAARRVSPPSGRGVTASVSFSWQEVLTTIRKEVVQRLRMGVASLLKQHGVAVVSGVGVFREPGRVEANGALLECGSVILACGASPVVPRAFSGDSRVLTSDDLWSLDRLPASLAIIGGGVIGCEFASIFRRFGVKVTVYEMLETILPTVDREIAKVVASGFARRGISIRTGQPVNSASDLPEERILVAVGRSPNLQDLSSRGIAVDNLGVVTDDRMRTNLPGVYAAGDITGRFLYAYVATREGETAAEHIATKDARIAYDAVPISIFTDPEVGACGMTEEQARSAGLKVLIGRFPYAALGKAHADGATEGMCKVIADEDTGRILGIHIVGEKATELAALASVALSAGMTVRQAEQAFFCHPTCAEAVMEALADSIGRCVHLPPKKR